MRRSARCKVSSRLALPTRLQIRTVNSMSAIVRLRYRALSISSMVKRQVCQFLTGWCSIRTPDASSRSDGTGKKTIRSASRKTGSLPTSSFQVSASTVSDFSTSLEMQLERLLLLGGLCSTLGCFLIFLVFFISSHSPSSLQISFAFLLALECLLILLVMIFVLL